MRSSRPRRSSAIILLTAIMLAGFILWASFAHLDQISRASGQIIPAGRVQILQSLDGGIIGEIFVREGAHVKKGQILVKLDRVKIAAAADEARARVAALKAEKIRIEAELFNRPMAFPKDTADFPEFVRNQRALYHQRRNALAQDLAVLRKMLGLMRQEYQMNLPLLKQGDVSRSEVMRLERSVTDIEGQIATRQNKYLQELQEQYGKVSQDLVTAEEILKQRLDSLKITDLRASTDGIVKNVRLTTIGAVLRPGDEVLQIVPTGDELLVEAKVAPSDIAYVRIGQGASVKFDAYDPSIYGAAEGKVIYISPDTLTEQKAGGEQLFYRLHIKVDTATMHPRGGQAIELQPGMTATVEIRTGDNTVLKYLLKPISKTLSASMTER